MVKHVPSDIISFLSISTFENHLTHPFHMISQLGAFDGVPAQHVKLVRERLPFVESARNVEGDLCGHHGSLKNQVNIAAISRPTKCPAAEQHGALNLCRFGEYVLKPLPRERPNAVGLTHRFPL